MKIFSATFLLLIGLIKLCLVSTANKMEVKELFYNTPIFVDVPPGTLQALITVDGLICAIGAITLFCL